MKIEHGSKNYQSGGDKMVKDPKFDYLLFRQDFGGSESVYFNKDEIDEVIEKIQEGEILIHPNYSVILARDQKLADEISEQFAGCYVTV